MGPKTNAEVLAEMCRQWWLDEKERADHYQRLAEQIGSGRGEDRDKEEVEAVLAAGEVKPEWWTYEKRHVFKVIARVVEGMGHLEKRMGLIEKGLRDLDSALETAQERHNAKA